MSSRAERRRIERELGRRRAEGKKGRRAARRPPDGKPAAGFPALEAAGFVLGAPKLVLPTEVAAEEPARLKGR